MSLGGLQMGRKGPAPTTGGRYLPWGYMVDMDGSNHPSYTWGVDGISLFDGLPVHAHDAAPGPYGLLDSQPDGPGGFGTIVNSVKASKPSFQWYLYTQAWVNGDINPWSYDVNEPTAPGHEEWFLHNPEGNLDFAYRVNRVEGGSVKMLMDPRQTGYWNWWCGQAIPTLDKYGLALFSDGKFYSGQVPSWVGWSIAPSQTAQDSWITWNTQAGGAMPTIRSNLGTRKWLLNTSEPLTVNGGSTPDLYDTPYLDWVDGTMAEGVLTLAWGTLTANGYVQMQALRDRAVSRGKNLVLYTIDLGTGNRDIAWPCFLTLADGRYVIAGADYGGTSTVPASLADVTRDTGNAIDPPGLTRRFEKVTVTFDTGSMTGTMTWL